MKGRSDAEQTDAANLALESAASFRRSCASPQSTGKATRLSPATDAYSRRAPEFFFLTTH